MNHTIQTPFMYEDFREAIDAVSDALTQAPGYALLLGDSGSGKTTLLRTLASTLDSRRFHILYMCHGRLSPACLIRTLAEELHLPLWRTRAETSRLLVRTLRNLPTRFLFFIDEAHLIEDDTLHELRLLAEADLQSPPLFSVLLSALPEIKERLSSPRLFPLWRRIRPKVTLTGLRRAEMEPFIEHSIKPGAAARFESHAIDTIFEQGRGTPALLADLVIECLETNPAGTITREQVIETLDQIENR